MDELNSYLKFASDLAKEAGQIMRSYFQIGVQYTEKADKTMVTEADQKINSLVISKITKQFPSHSVQGEEESAETDSHYVWACDPIDGTVPFAKGLPVAVFSLALVLDGEPIVGVVYDPFMDRLYTGVKGQGAFVNNQPIKVSSLQLCRNATLDVEWWPDAQYDVDTALHNLSKETDSYVLHLGSITHACCMVASGQYEAAVFPATAPTKNVDIAAVKVIVEEAGGKVTSISGFEQRYDQDINGAIVSNGVVHQRILEALKF